MRFTTVYYLFFFAAVYLVYWIVPRKRRPSLIAFASLVFYAAWSWEFSLHLLAVLFINFAFVRFLHDSRSRAALVAIVIANALNLIFFKYLYFLLDSAAVLIGVQSPGSALDEWLVSQAGIAHIVLPLAISFYTFQMIALQVDAYRGHLAERPAFSEFMMFSMYFPHFVAGPIMRHSDFFHQLRTVEPDEAKTVRGLALIGTGLVKKIVLADNVDGVLRPVFSNPAAYDWSTNLMAAFGFAARIYCDFSGYTDIARGSSRMLGLEIPENFKAPFLSRTVGEFWNRWHVTLMMWLRDYIYIPLGGSRCSPLRNYANLILVMVLSGIWHGASVTFVLWGLWNGILVSGEKLLGLHRKDDTANAESFISAAKIVSRLGGMVYVFITFSFGLILFNAANLDSAISMYSQIFALRDGLAWPHTEYVTYVIVAAFLFNGAQAVDWRRTFVGWKSYPALGAMGIAIVLLLGAFPPGATDFIYFRF